MTTQDLREIILANTGDTESRKNAYCQLGALLQENMDPEICQFFVDQLLRETDRLVLDAMLIALSKLSIPPQVNIHPMVLYTRHIDPLVRRSAIYSLRASDSDASREALRAWLQRKPEKFTRFELTYALVALGAVGRPEDLPLLQRYAQGDTLDVRTAAGNAIENIQNRQS